MFISLPLKNQSILFKRRPLRGRRLNRKPCHVALLVAETRIELVSRGYEPRELPLLYSAIYQCSLTFDSTHSTINNMFTQ